MRLSSKKIAYTGLFAAVCIIFSYVESIIPFELIIAVPGIKPGFSNAAVACAYIILGMKPALFCAFAKVIIISVLFGNPMTFLYSFAGTALSFLVTIMYMKFLNKFIGVIGYSVLSAAAHNLGQGIIAGIFFGKGIFVYYMPMIFTIGIFSGTLTGLVLYFTVNRVRKIYIKQKEA